MRVVILVPVLHRPHRVEPLLASIDAGTPEPHRIVFLCTETDQTQQDAVTAAGADMVVLPGKRRNGDYARKINLGYRATTEPVLFLAADDLIFHRGWYTTAAARLTDTIQVVGTNDLGNGRVTAGRHSTHTLVTRRYVDEQGTIDGPGEVLHEGYNHWYVDDEFVQTAQARNAFSPCLTSIVEHLHPAWHKGDDDDIYRLGQAQSRGDRRLFSARSSRIHAG